MSEIAARIPPHVLDEQWFGFVHKLIEGMQSAYRAARENDDTLSQKKLASRLGKKASFISRCLSGQQNMTIRTIHDLARAMDCRIEIRFQALNELRRSNNQPVSTSDQFEPLPTGSPGKALEWSTIKDVAA